MKDKKRIILCCMCIVMLLIFTIVYAEETASTTDLIEYDVVYTVTTTDNITTNTEFKIFMNASVIKGGDNEVIHTIEYDTTKVVPTDLCGFTYEKEISATTVENANVVIDSVDTTNGIIKYHFPIVSGRNTGINNVVKFKALSSITDAEIKYTIQ